MQGSEIVWMDEVVLVAAFEFGWVPAEQPQTGG
jgi:hypothetical protein